MSHLVVLRRTPSEIEVFGGDVYIDIDGKNVGVLKSQNLQFELSAGKHTVKMYKSHTMGTFIGFAETTIDVKEGEQLYARYSAPLMVNQSGNVIVASYESEKELDTIINSIEEGVHSDYKEQQIRNDAARKESDKNNASFIAWIIVIPIVAGLISWLVFMRFLW